MSKIYSIWHWFTGENYYFVEEFDSDRYELDVLAELANGRIKQVIKSSKKDFARCLFESVFDDELNKEQGDKINLAFLDAGFDYIPDYIQELLCEMAEEAK